MTAHIVVDSTNDSGDDVAGERDAGSPGSGGASPYLLRATPPSELGNGEGTSRHRPDAPQKQPRARMWEFLVTFILVWRLFRHTFGQEKSRKEAIFELGNVGHIMNIELAFEILLLCVLFGGSIGVAMAVAVHDHRKEVKRDEERRIRWAEFDITPEEKDADWWRER
jgi:hypothetical protein